MDRDWAAQHEAAVDDGFADPATDPPGAEWSGLIAAYDLAVDDEERTQLGRQLSALGVIELLVQPGDPLDTRQHNVVGRQATEQDDRIRTVASVERPGWRLSSAVADQNIRPADVTVWT